MSFFPAIRLVLQRANIIQSFFISQIEKELADPDLQRLEGPSGRSKDTSVAPSTAAETPQPASGAPPTRIKLVSNNSNGAANSSSGNPSDRD